MFYGNNTGQVIVEKLSIQLSNINSPWLYRPKTERSDSGRKVLQFKSVFKRKQHGLNKKSKTSPVQIQCFPLLCLAERFICTFIHLNVLRSFVSKGQIRQHYF